MRKNMEEMKMKEKAFLLFFKNIKNLSFSQYILDFNRGRCYNNSYCYGKLNKGKTLYYIEPCIKGGGFFANYRYLLMALIFADRCDYIPVVDFRKNFEYKEERPVYGTDNPFEYYFKQPGGISIKEAKNSCSVVNYHSIHCEMVELLLNGSLEFYHINEDFINAAAHVQKKYIELREETKNYINHNISVKLQNKKTLGVHVRGSDFKRNYNGHPIQVAVSKYIDKVVEVKEKFNFEKIFIATDDKKILKQFKEKFECDLVYYSDVIRTDKSISVMKSTVIREQHYYKLGLEVLRDVYTLSSCDGLVAGISQVVMGVRVIKRSLGKEFEIVEILDGGINHNKKYFK